MFATELIILIENEIKKKHWMDGACQAPNVKILC